MMKEKVYEVTKSALEQELKQTKNSMDNLTKQWKRQTIRLVIYFALIEVIYELILFCDRMEPLFTLVGWVLTAFLLFVYPLFLAYKVFVYMGDMGFPWCAKLFCGGVQNSYPRLRKEYQERYDELLQKLKVLEKEG